MAVRRIAAAVDYLAFFGECRPSAKAKGEIGMNAFIERLPLLVPCTSTP
jgi:hypothetical protein